ncbi:phage terminase large subunit [Methylobacterium marchantiae]|uniref:Phage terminase large subunit n=1 Tax=Methylobacterium marchantiae TaxID=600331 RepID=A0ABW3X278_9HYPH|nr:hypothetical protein AIGOOFII_3478 [Methylobacterium marchantiae]
MAKIIDPLKALQADREARSEPMAAEVAGARKKTARRPAGGPVAGPAQSSAPTVVPAADAYQQALKDDFRAFLTVLWRHLLGNDPNPIQLDMAYWLQHGPDRAITMAFRGFSKSWITGAYALWRLLRNPQEKILVVSGSLTRAVATTNWCLQLIMTMDELKHLAPKPNQRQSSKAFDVGPANPDQSPSFHALGIGGQIVGFRGDCIIPDDVETQTNSLTVLMREKVQEAVKEFDSVLKPGGVIKFLGTPHDEDSLYNALSKRGYETRIWPALYPNQEQLKKYGSKIAPYITQVLRRDPGQVGQSTMPMRFPMDDLNKRLLSLGRSEFALQFMLDTSLSDRDKYPLKVRDLMVMSLDQRVAPEVVSWSGDAEHRDTTLPSMGFEGDFWQKALYDPTGPRAPYTRIEAALDTAGTGKDEVCLAIVAELNATIFLLHLWAGHGGYDLKNLREIARACVRFRVGKLTVEDNFGDGMFTALLAPVLEDEWKKANKVPGAIHGGTEIAGVKASNQMAKEKRMLSVLEPAAQSHRIVVNRSVIEWDQRSIDTIDGEDTRHRYRWGYQYTHLTRDKDSLHHDDRVDAFALAVGGFADVLGVDPQVMATRASEDRMDEEWEKLFGPDDGEDENGMPTFGRGDKRAEGLKIQKR